MHDKAPKTFKKLSKQNKINAKLEGEISKLNNNI
jgi:hypothetical protein